MIRAIIIDDEADCIEVLENDLKMYCPQVVVEATCRSAKEGVMAMKRLKPDLVFLDVEMPWMNGFEMLEMLDNIEFKIIFTTAYSQFAIRAFKVSALDYLLKPIASDDLKAAVAKLDEAVSAKPTDHNITNLLANMRLATQQQKIAVPNRGGYEFIAVNDILYCKAEGRYTHLVLADRKLVLTKSLGETEQLLPSETFERVHHSLLVNMQHIKQYKKGEGFCIVMTNGDELTVSKIKKDNLLERLGIR